MLNKLLAQIRRHEMICPGDRVVCAVSGGADSVALLFALYLLKDKLSIILEAAHFNHGLRGEESDRDEVFVRELCAGYGIPCYVGRGVVTPGKKGLEAAARDARYAFFRTLDGKIATAHTADDNAETVLMHLVRGTGLKGLGGIMPVNGSVIRPLLTVSREDVLVFLQEYHLSFVEDSSNQTDDFLRNRLRHHVMPLLKNENPRLVQNLSVMAMDLRQDERVLQQMTLREPLQVQVLAEMPEALRRRSLADFLQKHGVKEPERAHIELVEKLVFSEKPSAWAEFPGNVRIGRCYDRLIAEKPVEPLNTRVLLPGETVDLPGLRVSCSQTNEAYREKNCFTVSPVGSMILRSRLSGDKIRLPGGTKSLKKLMIDQKIPEHERQSLVVLADTQGVLGVQGIGPNLDRVADSGVLIRFEER